MIHDTTAVVSYLLFVLFYLLYLLRGRELRGLKAEVASKDRFARAMAERVRTQAELLAKRADRTPNPEAER